MTRKLRIWIIVGLIGLGSCQPLPKACKYPYSDVTEQIPGYHERRRGKREQLDTEKVIPIYLNCIWSLS